MDLTSGRLFLELLVREAEPVEFEKPLHAARSSGAPRQLREELERARVLALQVRALLEHRRQREAELSALFDTASDLAALRDVDAVLEAIVHRARQLLHADVAYMTLNDHDRGDTYMRVTDGSVSAQFQRLRLPMGAGLGGLVAQTGTPYVTEGYIEDARFRHTADIDTAVGEEGLVGILGVPMGFGGRVVGVLFAANRGRRPFAREDVALLCSLGAHAAVAIDTTRVLQETRAALEELSAANETIRARGELVERAAEAHDRMAQLALRGGGVEDVATVAAGALGGALVLLDPQGRRLAAVGAIGDLEELDDDAVAAAAAASVRTARTVTCGDLLVCAVDAGTESLGTFVVRTEQDVGEVDRRIVDRAALVTAFLLLSRRDLSEAESRVRGELLDDLITRPGQAPGPLHERARRLGVDLRQSHIVVTARHDGGRQRAAAWAASHASARGGLSADRGADVVLLVPGERPGGAARAVARELTKVVGRPVTAGAAGPARGPESIAVAYREAQRCVHTLLALGRAGEGAGAADLGFVGLLLADNGDAGHFVSSTLGPVLDYDARRNTALLRTLESYFATGGSLVRTAQTLHVHVNTVTQRLDRVALLLGDDWQRPDRALEVQLALRLHRIRLP
ncbi:MAG: helix-turn-helix domain-containing protein [Carbonactinosporaceae bacterium]